MAGFLRLQLHFLWLGLLEAARGRGTDVGPVPPPRLRHRVHGSTDITGYLEVGRVCWADIVSIVESVGSNTEEMESILDFGCGTGRVIRNIEATCRPGRNICGVDIDRTAIDWCARHLPGYRFSTVSHEPPTPFADASFDLVFAISVFTHLNEAMQFSWLGELRRIVRPGGLVIASVQGEHHRSTRRRSFDMRDGFLFLEGSKGLFKKDGLPDFYQDAQHTRSYVEERWADRFEILGYRERGIGGHQDAVVMRRRT